MQIYCHTVSPYIRLENNMIVSNFFRVDLKDGESYLLYLVKGGQFSEHHSNIPYCSYKTIQSWQAFKHFSYIFSISLAMISHISSVWVNLPTSLLIRLFKPQSCWKENSSNNYLLFGCDRSNKMGYGLECPNVSYLF